MSSCTANYPQGEAPQGGSGLTLRADATGPVVVIGGMVLDVQGVPAPGRPLAAGTTVPGTIRHAAGGVGRNIAECVAALTGGKAPPPLLISAVGDDPAGHFLRNHLRSLGMPDRGIRHSALSTPCVAVVFDETGEVGAAVADVAALEAPGEAEAHRAWIRSFTSDIAAAALVVVDANLDEATIGAVAEMASSAGVPVWFEPVSVAKAARAAGCLRHLAIVSPNQAELRAMALAAGFPELHGAGAEGKAGETGREFEAQLHALAPYAGWLLGRGVGAVVLTLGAAGAAVLTAAPGVGVEAHLVAALPARVVSLTGAGDSLVAGCVAAMALGGGAVSLLAALVTGMAAAKMAVESELNVATELRDGAAVAALTKNAGGRKLLLPLPATPRHS
eukprot:jgi/Tetstr1/449309/TSEL_003824.t1